MRWSMPVICEGSDVRYLTCVAGTRSQLDICWKRLATASARRTRQAAGASGTRRAGKFLRSPQRRARRPLRSALVAAGGQTRRACLSPATAVMASAVRVHGLAPTSAFAAGRAAKTSASARTASGRQQHSCQLDRAAAVDGTRPTARVSPRRARAGALLGAVGRARSARPWSPRPPRRRRRQPAAPAATYSTETSKSAATSACVRSPRGRPRDVAHELLGEVFWTRTSFRRVCGA